MSNFLDELRNDHRDFDSGRLTDFFPETPFELFELWFNDAIKNNEKEHPFTFNYSHRHSSCQ